MFNDLVKESLLAIALLSGAPLLVSSCAGLVVAIVQSATQVQEQTSLYLVKLVAVCGTIFILSRFYAQHLQSLFTNAIELLPLLARMK